MIHAIVDQIISPIIESQLTWVSKWGGLAVLAEKQLKSGETFTYPVSVTRPSGCPPGKEPILSPDNNEMAVLWVEETSNVVTVIDERIAKRGGMQHTQSIRIVGWVNGPKLGEGGYHFSYSPEQDVIRVLQNTKLNNAQLQAIGIGDDLPIGRLSIKVVGTQEKDHRIIFADYSFSEGVKEQKNFNHPYDYFAIDFEVQWLVLENCIPSFQPGASLPCPPQGTGGGFVIVSDCDGNLINKGADGGACLTVDDLPGATDNNGMFSASNEGGAWLVSNYTMPNDIVASTILTTPSRTITYKNNNAEFKIQLVSITGFGTTLSIISADGLNIAGYSALDVETVFGSEQLINFNVQSNEILSLLPGGQIVAKQYGGGLQTGVAPSIFLFDVGGILVEAPLVSNDANNALSQGIDGGVFFIDAPNDGGSYLRQTGAWIPAISADAGNDAQQGTDGGVFITNNPIASGVQFRYRWDTAISGEPNSGDIAINNANPTQATEIRISKTTNGGDDVAFFWEEVQQGDIVGFEELVGNTESVYYRFTTLPTDDGTYFTIGVSWLGGFGIPENNRLGVVSLVQDPANKLPIGGSTGQVLKKISATDFDALWLDFDHDDLLNIGTNTHLQIDAHITDTNIHFVDAPADGSQYARIDNGWAVVSGGGGGDNGMFGGVNNNGTWAVTNFSLGGATIMEMGGASMNLNNGDLILGSYGIGNEGGIVAYPLAVDASGQVIEGPVNGLRNGMFDSANDGDVFGVENLSLHPNGLFMTIDANKPIDFVASGGVGLISFRTQAFQSSVAFTATNETLIFAANSQSTTNNIYFQGGTRDLRLGGTAFNVAHIKLVGSVGQVDFPQYGGGAFDDPSPARSLGVDGSGKVVTFLGAGPTQANESIIPDADIDESNTDITLPLITEVGAIHVVANPSGGSTINALPTVGNTIEGFTAIGNGEGGMFVAVNLTTWYRIKG